MKKKRNEISQRAKYLNEESTFVDVHNHMMFEFAIRKALGEKNIFDTHYAPKLREGKINVIATSVGANSPCLCNLTDDLEFGCFEQIDMLRCEEKISNTFRICTNVKEIEKTLAEDKIAVLLAFEGARALEGRYGEESLVMLRTFYELGLRVNCICGAARTAFADGMGEAIADGGLTTFGVKLIEEMNRIGMLIDLTHMNDRSFFDSLEVSNKPVIVSHIGVQKICKNPNNLSDERIKAIGRNKGVIGLEMVKTEIKYKAEETGERVTFDDVVDHIDHISSLIGPEHVGIGLDFDNFDLVHNIHRAMCPFPGSIEGFYTGIPKGDHMLDDPKNISKAYVIADYLVRRGYSDKEIKGILGKNLMRVFKEAIG
ncbi:dipeptidase [Maledivibacter halophilus]|uniref:Membrane dipeptidase n=1 Tax=Maledivibacter halophilus TaxID=36842 RepID=A0A1T5IAM6_9FIRM|nr:membrane dipeptidase [Maledivibacter halophilus]SKC36219.1 membrane dipeptidase [Maledivibacter halophilus]